jgi:proline iminopeptidase
VLRAARDHYWSHRHFIDDGAIARNAAKLTGIPGILIRGALDFGPPIDVFWQLARDWPESDLIVIDEEGHLGGAAMDAIR